jgi:hypothetical protein
MSKQISPAQAIIAIVLAIGLIGGIWWFAKGRGPAPANPQEVEKMLQNPSANPGADIK